MSLVYCQSMFLNATLLFGFLLRILFARGLLRVVFWGLDCYMVFRRECNMHILKLLHQLW